MSISHSKYKWVTRNSKSQKQTSGTSTERFVNTSHDDIQNLMDKSGKKGIRLKWQRRGWMWSPISDSLYFGSYVINQLSHLWSCNVVYFSCFSYFYILFSSLKGSWKKSQKHEKLEKYLPCCTRQRQYLLQINL